MFCTHKQKQQKNEYPFEFEVVTFFVLGPPVVEMRWRNLTVFAMSALLGKFLPKARFNPFFYLMKLQSSKVSNVVYYVCQPEQTRFTELTCKLNCSGCHITVCLQNKQKKLRIFCMLPTNCKALSFIGCDST